MRHFPSWVNGFLVNSSGQLSAILIAIISGGQARADVFNMPPGQTSIQFVPIADPGNPADPRVQSDGTSGYGSVAYAYGMDSFKTTIGQYVQFLNAVAATDTYALYNPNMTTRLNIAGVARNGSPGSYSYTAIGSSNKPIAYVSWGDAARFANWMTNGQPTGIQSAGTTETGSYAINGATSDAALHAVTRSAGARYVIPSENEWYKAAYYDPTKGGSNYWLYPMRTDIKPNSAPPPGNGAPNSAHTGNFYQDDATANTFDNGYAVTGSTTYASSQNYLTDVGAYTLATTYYGTFDQDGNLTEWDETAISGTLRGLRGSSWIGGEGSMRASQRTGAVPSFEDVAYGFRVAEVPEPTGAMVWIVGWVALVRRRRPVHVDHVERLREAHFALKRYAKAGVDGDAYR